MRLIALFFLIPQQNSDYLGAIYLLIGDLSALYWLVAVIIGLLMSAARSSWDLLVKVGEERRTAKGAG